jgi:outer membrane protein TolC
MTVDDCIKTAYINERKYLTAKERENLARLGVKYSRLKRYPSFSFFTTNDYAVDQAFGDEFGFRVGIIASYPLYDAGETRSIIRGAESHLRSAILDLRKEKEARTLDVTEKYYKLRNQIELLRITREKEKQFAEDWARAEMDFKNGSISQLEHEQFRYAYVLSDNRVKELELDVMLAQSNLLRSMGIGNLDQLVK